MHEAGRSTRREREGGRGAQVPRRRPPVITRKSANTGNVVAERGRGGGGSGGVAPQNTYRGFF